MALLYRLNNIEGEAKPRKHVALRVRRSQTVRQTHARSYQSLRNKGRAVIAKADHHIAWRVVASSCNSAPTERSVSPHPHTYTYACIRISSSR